MEAAEGRLRNREAAPAALAHRIGALLAVCDCEKRSFSSQFCCPTLLGAACTCPAETGYTISGAGKTAGADDEMSL